MYNFFCSFSYDASTFSGSTYGSPIVVKLIGPKYDDFILPVRLVGTLTLGGSVIGLPFSPLFAYLVN